METTNQSIESAVEALMAPSESEIAEVDTTETEVAEVEEAEVEQEAEYEDSDDDAEIAEDEDEDDGDEYDKPDNELDDQEEPALHPVKVDGVISHVTLEDLIKGFGGNQFVQQGMKQNAEVRKQAEEAYNGLNQQRAQLEQLMQQVQQQGVMAQPAPPTKELLADDPLGYIEADANYREEMGKYQHQQQQLGQQHQAMQQAQEQANKANLQNQQQELKRLIPDFAEAKKAPKLKDSLIEHGKKRNFTEAEINSVVDARTMHVLYESMMWRQSLEGKSNVQAKLKKARPLMKAGSKKQPESDSKKRSKQMSQLKRSGSVADAAALLFE